MFDQAVQLVRPGGVIVYSTWVQSFIHAIIYEISLACLFLTFKVVYLYIIYDESSQ